MKLVVHSGFGIETATKIELRRMGIEAGAIGGRFIFDGGSEDIVRLNIGLRTADRVSVLLGEFSATTFDELFDGIKRIDWKSLVHKNARIVVNARSTDSTLFALSAIQSISKKAILSSITRGYWNEDGASLLIHIEIVKDVVSVLLDTSGAGLHKRGYRDYVAEAPIKETIAAALVELSVWNPDRILVDPFCGSGTIPIEAAMIAHNIAPGINRSFAFEGYSFIDPRIVSDAREEARSAVVTDKKYRIYGYDINRDAIKLSLRHLERVGLKDKVHFEVMDARKLVSSHPYGVVITNPPYGERLLNEKSVRELYSDFSRTFSALPDWSLYLVTSLDGFEKTFGRRADKNRKLFNANIQIREYCYLGARPPKKTP